MKLFLLKLGHDVEGSTVLTPFVVPASDVDQAASLGFEIADRLGEGIELLEEPEELESVRITEADFCDGEGV